MIYTLEDYEVTGNQVLLKLELVGEQKKSTLIGVKTEKPKASKWMEVVKVGSLVTSVIVGDFAIMGDPSMTGMAQMSFGDDSYMQVSEHAVIGKIPLGKIQLEEIVKP
jgi:hypothetical protein